MKFISLNAYDENGKLTPILVRVDQIEVVSYPSQELRNRFDAGAVIFLMRGSEIYVDESIDRIANLLKV